MFNIKNNFLSNKEYKEIYNILTNEAFPWYYNNYKGTKEEKLLEYQFVHTFFNEKVTSPFYQFLNPILKKLKIKKLIKVKANLNPISQKIIKFNTHQDSLNKNYVSSIFYINTNNGYTKIDNKKIKSQSNKIITFCSKKKHYGTNSTNLNNRIVINFIYVV